MALPQFIIVIARCVNDHVLELFFKFQCILRIYAWFLMHCRNHHSDSHANHVIKHIYILIHIVRLSELYIVTSINVPPITVIPAGVDLVWPGGCQDPSAKSLSHDSCPRLNTTRAPEWPTIRDGNKRNLKGRPGSLLLGCYWAFLYVPSIQINTNPSIWVASGFACYVSTSMSMMIINWIICLYIFHDVIG